LTIDGGAREKRDEVLAGLGERRDGFDGADNLLGSPFILDAKGPMVGFGGTKPLTGVEGGPPIAGRSDDFEERTKKLREKEVSWARDAERVRRLTFTRPKLAPTPSSVRKRRIASRKEGRST
jgi:hypothetical protein